MNGLADIWQESLISCLFAFLQFCMGINGENLEVKVSRCWHSFPKDE